MSVDAISQANGADLLSLFAQSTNSAAATTSRASQYALQQAIQLAKLSESEIVGQADVDTGNNLNVYA